MYFSQNSVWRHSFYFGMLVGGLFVLSSLLFYFKEQPVSINPRLTSINYFLAFTGIFMGVKRYRDLVLKGQITYGNALGAGVIILFTASLVFAFYTYILVSYDPAILDQFLVIVREGYENAGLKDELLDQIMPFYEKVTPGAFAFAEIFNKTFIGLVFSLILAVFLKRDRNLLKSQPINKFGK